MHLSFQAVANVAWAAAVLAPTGPAVLQWVHKCSSHIGASMCAQQSVQMHQYFLEYEPSRAMSSVVGDALGIEGDCGAASCTESQVMSVLGNMGLEVVREWREPATGMSPFCTCEMNWFLIIRDRFAFKSDCFDSAHHTP